VNRFVLHDFIVADKAAERDADDDEPKGERDRSIIVSVPAATERATSRIRTPIDMHDPMCRALFC